MQDSLNNPMGTAYTSGGTCTQHSGGCWGAIASGAVVMMAVTLAFVLLAAGLGLIDASPWEHQDFSATSFTIKTIVAIIVIQWISSFLGGYITGRMRKKWHNLHDHECYFRDTAHGFVAWCLATVLSVILMASAVSSMIGGTVHAAAMAAPAAAEASRGPAGPDMNPMNYYSDSLFRGDRGTEGGQVRREANGILMNNAKEDSFSDADHAYLVQLVAARTGVSADEATRRVDGVLGEISSDKVKAKQAADKARKAGASFAIFTFLSLIIGAFIASVSAAFAGGHRNELFRS